LPFYVELIETTGSFKILMLGLLGADVCDLTPDPYDEYDQGDQLQNIDEVEPPVNVEKGHHKVQDHIVVECQHVEQGPERLAAVAEIEA
jgi:hypothetical protein